MASSQTLHGMADAGFLLSVASDPQAVYGRSLPCRAAAIDIHDIALTLYTAMVANSDTVGATDASRAALGREAYHCAEAFIAAKDTYIRELPVATLDPAGF